MKTIYEFKSLLAFGLFFTLVLNTTLAWALSPPSANTPSGSNKTHLNVKVKVLVNLESLCIDNDNQTTNQFYYDGTITAPFSIPDGFSFVVTDIIVLPNCAFDFPTDGGFTLAYVESPATDRNFTAQFSGKDTKHFALAGGIAFPFGSNPHPRNTFFSSGNVRIQILGYFVPGTALQPGKSTP